MKANKLKKISITGDAADKMSDANLKIEFSDNKVLPMLFGQFNSNLALIENKLDIVLNARGNKINISGTLEMSKIAVSVLNALYQKACEGISINEGEVNGVLRMNSTGVTKVNIDTNHVSTKKKKIYPRSHNQADYFNKITNDALVFGLGPAGTGKTYLAVAKAVESLINGRVDRIILSRPAVEAGEQLGFLPGDMREKVDPYLRPLYDALHDMLPENQVAKKLDSGEIEIAPLAFMRGRTLADAFVILDEAQNTTPMQMKMFLTRLGENASMVVTGDLTQVDLPGGQRSGLLDAVDILEGTDGVGFVRFDEVDVVRHPLVAKIINAYAKKYLGRSNVNR